MARRIRARLMAQPEFHNHGQNVMREFGFVMAGAIAGIFGLLLPWMLDHPWPLWPWPIALIFLGAGLFWPKSLRATFKWWMRLGHLISRITTPLLLGILYFLIITPVGLIRRALQKDSMARHIDSSVDTYKVDSCDPDHSHMERPF